METVIYLTNSVSKTQELAEKFASQINPGDVLAFYGELGSGKTSFIQGLAKGLGIKRRIMSPTFIIVRSYALDDGSFYHVDLYRIQNNADLLGTGIDQLINDKNSIVALEWAEKMGTMLPARRIEVHIEDLKNDKRRITVVRYEQ